jgi:hypothetical protein
MLACFGVTAGANGFWFDVAVHRIKTGYRENVRWPSPYVCPDRMHVRAPFDLMVQNGWRRQNLLSPHHFNEDGTALSTAGELKVRWILTQAPPQFRQIFIERSIDPNVTQRRLAIAEQFAAQVTPGEEPIVSDTNLIAEGRPASVVDAINTRFMESPPPVQLPQWNDNPTLER